MDKYLLLGQFVVATLIFLGVATICIVHICNGYISGFGYLISISFVYIAWLLMCWAWAEFIEQKNK